MLQLLEDETRALTQAALPEGAGRLRAEVDQVIAAARQQGLPVSVRCHGPLRAVPSRIVRGAMVVLTEALANAGRHARATSIEVEITARAGMMLVRVRDDGAGCDAARLMGGSRAGRGCGIEIMRAQAAALNGRVDLSSAAGRGTQVSLFVPLPASLQRTPQRAEPVP
jgi:signal transduction histidine kinase